MFRWFSIMIIALTLISGCNGGGGSSGGGASSVLTSYPPVCNAYTTPVNPFGDSATATLFNSDGNGNITLTGYIAGVKIDSLSGLLVLNNTQCLSGDFSDFLNDIYGVMQFNNCNASLSGTMYSFNASATEIAEGQSATGTVSFTVNCSESTAIVQKKMESGNIINFDTASPKRVLFRN